MTYKRNSLPTKVRDAVQAEFTNASVVALQNNRMDISHPTTDYSVGGSAETQLTTFRQAVMDILNGMEEKFVMIKDSDKVNEDGNTLTLRVRAVDYVAPEGSTGSRKKNAAPVNIEDAINDFITKTTVQIEEYFGQEVSHPVYAMLNEANNKRKEAAEKNALLSTLTAQFGSTKAERLAALLAEVLKQEEANDAASSEGDDAGEATFSDGVESIVDEAVDTMNSTITPNTKSKRNSRTK